MRISDSMRLDLVTRSIAKQQGRVAEAERQASSGARVGRPSDDPVAAAQAARVQAALDRTSACSTTVSRVRGDVAGSESALAEATTVLGDAQDLAMRGANGSLSASDRALMVSQVTSLRDQLLALANSKGARGFLFGGTRTGAPPFDAAGVYQGDDAHPSVEVCPGLEAQVGVTGARAFTAAGGTDVFAVLDALGKALAANDQPAIASSVNALDSCSRQIVAARGDAGVQMARLDSADAANQAGELALASQRHDLVDADPAGAYTRLAAAQQALTAAVSVAQTTLQTLGRSTG